MKKSILLVAFVSLSVYGAIQPVRSSSPWPADHSKLGIHSILPDGTANFVQSAVAGGTRFSVVKAVDDLGYLSEVKEASPGTITVARLNHPHEGAHLVNDPATNLEWYAGVIMDFIFAKLDLDPVLANVVDYWEPINEPLGGGSETEKYLRLAQLMLYCMDRAEERGLRLALFSFNNGTPEWVDMQAIVETGVFARAMAGGHILAVHEGVWGDDPIDTCFGPGNVDGAPDVPGSGCLTGRYRYWYHLLEQRDEVVSLFVSEFYAGGGYGDDADIDDIVSRMAWYDSQLRLDNYALGFAPFTLGPVGQWVSQDYGFAYPALVEYMVNLADKNHFVYLPLSARELFPELDHRFYLPIAIK